MPIAMSEKEWARIKQWTNCNPEDPDVTRRREYINYLTTTSSEMTKSWPNSLENMNKRNEELRQARIFAAEQTNTNFYKKYLKKQKHEQEQLMYSARDTVFKDKDAPKLLLSAVIETATQKERMEQLNFLNELRRQEAELKRQDDDNVIRMAKEWNELMALKKRRRFEANKQYQREILEQAHEISERKRTEHEAEVNQQKLDNIAADDDIAALKRFENYYRTWEKERILNDIQTANEQYKERKHEQQKRDKMDDDLIDVLNRARARVEYRRKKTESDTKAEKQRILDKISKKMQVGSAGRDAKEQEILNKAIKQKREADDARLEADRRKVELFKQQRKEQREQFLRSEEQRLHELQTTRQWDLMNRFKNVELYKEFKENLRKENERKIQEHRADILKLWKERDDREAQERAESRYFYGELAEQKIRDGDNKVLTHAAHLLDEAKKYGRPDYALHRTIDTYCKMHRLYPMPPLPDSLAEHFQRYKPWDGSKPDPGYTEPPAPAPLTPPRPLSPASDGHGHGHGDSHGHDDSHGHAAEVKPPPPGKRDGLQNSPKAGPSKPAAANTSDDYKRAARADGLQRRNLQTSPPDLPQVTVIPCRNPACTCDLKP